MTLFHIPHRWGLVNAYKGVPKKIYPMSNKKKFKKEKSLLTDDSYSLWLTEQKMCLNSK